jgi:hypothetical protein
MREKKITIAPEKATKRPAIPIAQPGFVVIAAV